MPFRPPLLTVCKQFVSNTSGSRNIIIVPLIYLFELNPDTAPLSNTFGRLPLCGIEWICQIHAIRGANGVAMAVRFLDVSYCHLVLLNNGISVQFLHR
jgi:hypothetical protein